MIKILKRDGSVVDYNSEKVLGAIIKAMAETQTGTDTLLAEKIVKSITRKIKSLSEAGASISVENIQDLVEESLAINGRFDVSRRYVLYRNERARLRDRGWAMNDLQKDIYEKKYRYEGESFDGFLNRISASNPRIKKAVRDKKLMPAGRILAGRGLDKLGKKITLSNCYVLPKVEDNIESIFDTAKYLARTYSYGGGVGLTISKLRPKGAKVNNAANTTTGAISFMNLYSMVTGLIGMRGRRGALMLNLDVSHPDIEDFIDVKNDLTKVTSANISVNITSEFMTAVLADSDYDLRFTVEATGEQIVKKIRAKDLFRKLARNNWNMAEPGILYQDRINSWHLMSEDDTFEFAGVNPCAEETLPAFGSCNLSSINLSEFVKHPFTKEATFDYIKFAEMINDGVIYLNEVLDENMNLHPLVQQREMSRDLRQIGLGVMGVADMFIKLGVKYGSEESIDLIHKVGKIFINEALRASALLAKEQGTFPLYRKEAIMKSPFLLANAMPDVLGLIDQYGLRNSQLLTIAPTGSISTLIGCSNGVEPIFQISYTRKSESLHNIDTYYKVFTPVAKEYMELHEIVDEKDLPDYFITTSSLNYEDRINVQAAWQQYIDASISSTVNVPNEFTVEQVEELYTYAWLKGLKGTTLYRDGCARSGILITDKPKQSRIDKIEELQDEIANLAQEELKENPDACPMCGSELVHSGGCSECLTCGYSPCSI